MSPITFAERPLTSIQDRPASIIEYGHACIAFSGQTLEVPRVVTLVLPGRWDAHVRLSAWRSAIAEATEVNPGTRLALSRRRGSLRWNSTAAPPRLRLVDHTDWDGRSPLDGEFLDAEPLDLTAGPTVEVILVGGKRQFVVVRALHAVSDSWGLIHFTEDLFRGLRDEELVGTNTVARDWDLLRNMHCRDYSRLAGTPPHATGSPDGDAPGDTWQAIRLPGSPPQLLPTVLAALAGAAARHSDQPARFALPVDLRRYYPQLRTSLNAGALIFLDVAAADPLTTIAGGITDKLATKAAANVPRSLPALRAVPMGVLDRMTARTAKNLTRRAPRETAVVSDLGHHRASTFSGGGFVAEGIYTLPIPGNTYVSVASMDGDIWLAAGTGAIYATAGRLDDLVGQVRRAVTTAARRAAPVEPEPYQWRSPASV